MLGEVIVNKYRNPEIKLEKTQDDKFKGKDICGSRYAQFFLLARKNSGKTNSLLNLIKYRSDRKKTTIIIFAATVDKDPLYVQTVKNMRLKGYRVITFNSIFDENDNNIVSELTEMLESVHPQASDPFGKELEQEEVEVDEDPISKMTPEEQLKFKMTGKISGAGMKVEEEEEEEVEIDEEDPFGWIGENDEFMIVFDDMPTEELRNKAVVNLMKKNRHLKTQIVVSSQWIKDITPSQRKQIDCWMIFQGQNDENLKTVLKDSGVGIEFDEFKQVYEQATREKYHFLLIDARTSDPEKYFRRDFNTMIKIN